MSTRPITVYKDKTNNPFAVHKSPHKIDSDLDGYLDLGLFFKNSELQVQSASIADDGSVEIIASSMLAHGVCPYCQNMSYKIHSHYNRTLRDLPCFGRNVSIKLHVRKFFCHNDACSKQTFAEQPGNEIFRYRRRTRRCEVAVYRQGMATSSGQAARLLSMTGINISGATVLRDLHRLGLPETGHLKNIGVDDWAFKKGIDYGTIIVDLKTNRVMDMLGTRTEGDFKSWLDNHPSVRLVSRDRSTEYSAAISSTGRNITEVADRFHLLKNMGECVTRIISDNYKACVEATGVKQTSDKNTEPKDSNRAKNYVNEVKFNEVKRLQKEGKNIAEIAMQLGIARQTVRKYRNLDSFPIPAKKPRNAYFRYEEYVACEYRKGRSLSEIYEDVVKSGFKGARTPFYDHFKYLSDGHKGYRSKAEKEEMARKEAEHPIESNAVSLPPASALSLIVAKSIYEKEMSNEECRIMNSLFGMDWFDETYDAATSFADIIRKNRYSKLKTWLEKYGESPVKHLRTLVLGVKRDCKAVENTLVYKVSNGIVEGFVNKLKSVKRYLYGKAKLPLLKRKMILGPVFLN